MASPDPRFASSARSEAREKTYPSKLMESEREALHQRRGGSGRAEDAFGPEPWSEDAVGLALSGGGIRSATFGLGLLQALARKDLLRRIDILSTVSGGGYVGAFFGKLVQKKGMAGAQKALEPGTGPSGAESFPVRWLRENGYYLAPTGAGDEALLAAAHVRNWVAVWVVLALLALTGFLVLDARWWLFQQSSIACFFAPGPGAKLWWSPWWIAALGWFVFMVFPGGWAYWIVSNAKERVLPGEWDPVKVQWAVVIISILLAAPRWIPCAPRWLVLPDSLVCTLVAVAALGDLTLIHYGLAWWAGRASVERGGEDAGRADGIAQLRWRLSRRLKVWLMGLGGLLGLWLVDSLGQSLYAVLKEGGLSGFKYWAGGLGLGLLGLASMARKFTSWLPQGKEKPKIPLMLIAGFAGFLVASVMLVALNTLAHGITWGWEPPSVPYGPHQSLPVGQLLLRNARAQIPTVGVDVPHPVMAYVKGDCIGVSIDRFHLSGPLDKEVALECATPVQKGDPGPSKKWYLLALAAAGALSLVFGRARSFLNQSGMGVFYRERLTRAYLGASNKARETGSVPSVRDQHPGDNLEWAAYAPHRSGGPLHLINVTINETFDGKSQVQQRDRKGLGMSVGPCGLSVGVRHHAVWRTENERAGAPALAGVSSPSEGYAVFPAGEDLRPEALSLGQWVGISGAAFNTGMGARTSLGLSLLCGTFNIRLGHWWYSGVKHQWEGSLIRDGWMWHRVSRLLPVQAHLLDEFLARFPGTARRHWFLSDGGHFENTGVYELARRRVKHIIYSDAGADADYIFDDLANLALKLRADFGAELEMVKDHPLYQQKGSAFVPLEGLRRGNSTSDRTGVSKGHATLGKIVYPEGAFSWLLVLKPTLTGDEPVDLGYYHARHPDFPQQGTLDQCFDEAQWESYRKLGEHIGSKVFGATADPSGRWLPYL